MKNDLRDQFKTNESATNKPKTDRFVMIKVAVVLVFMVGTVALKSFSNNPRYQHGHGSPLFDYIIDQSAYQPWIGALFFGVMFPFFASYTWRQWEAGKAYSLSFLGNLSRTKTPVRYWLHLIISICICLFSGGACTYFAWHFIQQFRD